MTLKGMKWKWLGRNVYIRDETLISGKIIFWEALTELEETVFGV